MYCHNQKPRSEKWSFENQRNGPLHAVFTFLTEGGGSSLFAYFVLRDRPELSTFSIHLLPQK